VRLNCNIPPNILYQLPDAPPPLDEPPPPEKLDPLELPPELQELPEPPDEIMKPPIEALPFVRNSLLALLYQLVCLKRKLFFVEKSIGKEVF
jgi:hypothetical protein